VFAVRLCAMGARTQTDRGSQRLPHSPQMMSPFTRKFSLIVCARMVVTARCCLCRHVDPQYFLVDRWARISSLQTAQLGMEPGDWQIRLANPPSATSAYPSSRLVIDWSTPAIHYGADGLAVRESCGQQVMVVC
jgi:hypothetical protein